jgi:hypothetical protein
LLVGCFRECGQVSAENTKYAEHFISIAESGSY